VSLIKAMLAVGGHAGGADGLRACSSDGQCFAFRPLAAVEPKNPVGRGPHVLHAVLSWSARVTFAARSASSR
jgi:hypothetical protein